MLMKMRLLINEDHQFTYYASFTRSRRVVLDDEVEEHEILET